MKSADQSRALRDRGAAKLAARGAIRRLCDAHTTHAAFLGGGSGKYREGLERTACLREQWATQTADLAMETALNVTSASFLLSYHRLLLSDIFLLYVLPS